MIRLLGIAFIIILSLPDYSISCPQVRDEIIRFTRIYLPFTQPSLIAGQVTQESLCNPVAKSKVGAAGIMQIMPGTAKDIERACKLPGFDVFNPKQAVQGGICYNNIVRRIVRPMDNASELDVVMLRAYNGGAGYILRERKRAILNNIYAFDADNLPQFCTNFRSISSCRENTSYPVHIRKKQRQYSHWD